LKKLFNSFHENYYINIYYYYYPKIHTYIHTYIHIYIIKSINLYQIIYIYKQPLVVRICFILGNLSCERTSCIPDIIFDYIPDLVQLLELLVRKTINKEKKSEESDSQEESNENENENENDKIIKEDQYLKEKEEEDVLIKVIIIIHNS